MPHKRKIKGKDHYIFSDKQEFRKKYPDEPIVDNWKEAEESQWCYSDDKQIVMVIKKGSFQGNGTDKRKVVKWVDGHFGSYREKDLRLVNESR